MSFPSTEDKENNKPTVAQLEVDTLVAQVASEDISVSTKALEQLDELLKDPSKNVLLKGRVNQLMRSIGLRWDKMDYIDFPMPNPDINCADVVLLYQNLCAILTSLISCDQLIKVANMSSLEDLFVTLILLVEEELPIEFDFKPIVFKLVEQSDHTACVIALVKLLEYCLLHTPEFVIKCLRHFDQLLPSVIDQVKVRRMLEKIHRFFVRFPMQYWKDQPDQTPMRILKTLLHTVVKQLGSGVLDHIRSIANPQHSEVVSYLRNAIAARPSG